MESRYRITTVQDAAVVERHLTSLRELLQHCVNDEPAMSSIGFLAPLSDHNAVKHWLQFFPTIASSKADTVFLIATETASDEVVATVQVVRVVKETHRYKGEVRKLLVHPAHRRGGLGRTMMIKAEELSRSVLDLEMLVLDTATRTPARDFYMRLGWKEWGICPEYAKFADGKKADCSFFVKMLT
ncbi:hypothetical protein JDV02_002524 [Purpureocillium takamizusanense]|uniref:N-acetyltransferase domain-containing protein n=1 Tax=Purpureocillium takamizusanense TaxID=2060973 RepID=A0A9Q8QB67_9HYPO|nr:uncharacterized protein JDV02_002524 [Purpureocillium takamizusanense]UNI16048.1 hypothetical protein JDV02_002524 [Purpureocillium takamizusanense]